MAIEAIEMAHLPLAELASMSSLSMHTTVACLVWILWDWIVTLDQEIEFIWLKKRSFSKYLYFLTRYYGILLLTFEMTSESRGWIEEFCTSYYFVMGISTAILLFIVEIGMQFRVAALYNCSRKIILMNSGLFACEVLAITTMLALDLSARAKPLNSLTMETFLTGCWNLKRPYFTFANWLIGLAYELYLFSLVAAKALGRSKYPLTGMFKVMFRDAAIWFVFIAGLLGWNAFAFLRGHDGYVFIGLPFLHSGASIGGSCLLLNLSQAYYHPQGLLSTIAPAPPPSVVQRHELRTLPSSSTATTIAYKHRAPRMGNALHLDFGGCETDEEDDDRKVGRVRYSYSSAWAESGKEIWDNVDCLELRGFDEQSRSRVSSGRGRSSGMTRDWTFRATGSRSASRSRTNIR